MSSCCRSPCGVRCTRERCAHVVDRVWGPTRQRFQLAITDSLLLGGKSSERRLNLIIEIKLVVHVQSFSLHNTSCYKLKPASASCRFFFVEMQIQDEMHLAHSMFLSDQRRVTSRFYCAVTRRGQYYADRDTHDKLATYVWVRVPWEHRAFGRHATHRSLLQDALWSLASQFRLV